MTCLSCHNPHESVQQLDPQYFVNICLKCHQSDDQKKCSETLEERSKVDNQCSTCHMPKSGSIDIAHVRITDHKIQRSPSKEKNLNGNKSFFGLEMLTKTNPGKLDMARGYLAYYDKYATVPNLLDSVKFYLDQCAPDQSGVFDAEIHFLFNKKDYPSIIQKQKTGIPARSGMPGPPTVLPKHITRQAIPSRPFGLLKRLLKCNL